MVVYAGRMRVITFILFAFVQSTALAGVIRSTGVAGDQPDLVYQILSQGKILDSWTVERHLEFRHLLIDYDQKLYVCQIVIIPPEVKTNGMHAFEGFGVECHDNFPKKVIR